MQSSRSFYGKLMIRCIVGFVLLIAMLYAINPPRVARDGMDPKEERIRNVIYELEAYLAAREYLDECRGTLRLNQALRKENDEELFFRILDGNGATHLWNGEYLLDPWGHALRCTRVRGYTRIYSIGPNGIDEDGNGDDIPRIPERKMTGPRSSRKATSQPKQEQAASGDSGRAR